MSNKTYLTIDIGSKNIKILSGCFNNGIIDVFDYDIIPTTKNSFNDGEIMDIDLLINTIKNSISKFSVKVKKVILTITGSNIVARNIQVPKAEHNEIEKMITFELVQFLPSEVEDYSIDYKIIEDIESPNGLMTQVLAVAVPNKQVEKYLDIHQKLKLKLEAIDSPLNCISKFFLGLDEKISLKDINLKGEFAVIDFGAETTSIYICTEKGLKFNRVLQIGSNEIERELSTTFEIGIESAEKLKHSKAKFVEEALFYDLDDETAKIIRILRQVINNILLEINRLFDFYNSRFNVKGIEKIFLCGGGGSIEGLDKYIENYFNISTELVKFSDVVRYKGNKDTKQIEKDFIFLINTIGAILRV